MRKDPRKCTFAERTFEHLKYLVENGKLEDINNIFQSAAIPIDFKDKVRKFMEFNVLMKLLMLIGRKEGHC